MTTAARLEMHSWLSTARRLEGSFLKSICRHRCRNSAPDNRTHLERLESRELLTAAAAGALHPLQQLPNEATISSPKFSDLWHLKNLTQPGSDVHAEDAWDLTTGSNNVVIALFDTGIDFN